MSQTVKILRSTTGGATPSLVSGQIAINEADDLLFWRHRDGTINSVSLSPWSTGDVKPTLKAAADSGWVMMDDRTIGDASSGASNRANADTAQLFALLWNNVSNTYCAVSSGRGASAAADYAAHKTIALPKALGRALAVAGSGSGLTARSLGQTAGEETHALSTTEMPSHAHALATPHGGLAVHGLDSGSLGPTGGAYSFFGLSNTDNAGGGGAHNNMQPTTFLNFMVKL